jgi:hypothetical protein
LRKRRGQNRRPFLRFLFFLDFNLRDEDGWRNRGNRYAARFRAANAVEDLDMIVCGLDFTERGQRGTDQVR